MLHLLLSCGLAKLTVDCDGVTSCQTVKANGLEFDCRKAGDSDGVPVLLVHGFPEWSDIYTTTLVKLAPMGYFAVACNMRGYSVGARPDESEDFNYFTLASDIYAIADAFGMEKFHLVGHDHGGELGWVASAKFEGQPDINPDRLYSYTSLSVPPLGHLEGDQVDASQYFRAFSQVDSASHNNAVLFQYMAAGAKGPDPVEKWDTAEDFQKALWWYNGMVQASVTDYPAYIDPEVLKDRGFTFSYEIIEAYGNTPNHDGIKATAIPAKTDVSGMLICGKSDPYLLCPPGGDPNYKPDGSNGSMMVPNWAGIVAVDGCAHEMPVCGKNETATAEVFNALVGHLKSTTPSKALRNGYNTDE